MQYKKIWSIVLLFVLGMALVACGSSNATPEKSTPVAVTEPTGEATAKPAPANVQGRPGGGGLVTAQLIHRALKPSIPMSPTAACPAVRH